MCMHAPVLALDLPGAIVTGLQQRNMLETLARTMSSWIRTPSACAPCMIVRVWAAARMLEIQQIFRFATTMKPSVRSHYEHMHSHCPA